VPQHLVGPTRLVVAGVEQVRAAGPGQVCRGVDDRSVDPDAGGEVPDVQRVALVALQVHPVREQAAVRRHQHRPEREEVVALGLGVAVE